MTEDSLRYERIERIGRASSGEVFLGQARSLQLDERWPVALKVLDAPYQREYLQHEAQRLRDLRVAHALGPIDVIELEGLPGRSVIVMDLVQGADLYELRDTLHSRGEPLPLRALVQVGAALFSVLARTHSAPGYPLLHRSLNPADIRVSARGEVSVVDFAVHRHATASAEPFCAPEQRGNSSSAPESAAGDVYAAAAIVVWLLSGREPEVPPLERHEAWLESALRALPWNEQTPDGRTTLTFFRAALSRNPANRPAASATASILEELARGLGGVELPGFAARLVPLTRATPGKDEAGLSRRSRLGLPQGLAELGFAILTVGILGVLAALGTLLLLVIFTLHDALVPLEREPEPVTAPVQPPQGFREDPFLHPSEPVPPVP